MYPNSDYDPKAAAQAPPPYPPPPYASQAVGQWSSGLCDCFNDPSNCCLTWCCPCITFGRIAEVTDRGQTSCFMAGLIYVALAYVGCQCLYSMTYRSKLRGSYSLPEDPCGDCCVHFWCETCALCQEHRELKARGLDPTIGWMVNADKMNAAAATAPPFVAPTMNR